MGESILTVSMQALLSKKALRCNYFKTREKHEVSSVDQRDLWLLKYTSNTFFYKNEVLGFQEH